jgi:gamma-D-glutamyl-L-lysine dipeptidyl-peptidase
MPHRFAVVVTPLAHLQARPNHQSELKSQRAAGEVLRVLDRRGTWLLAAGADRYPGWVRSWSVRLLGPQAARAWSRAAKLCTWGRTVNVRRTPGGSVIAALPLGARLRPLDPHVGRGARSSVQVELAAGERGFVDRRELGPAWPPALRRAPAGVRAAALARSLAGTTYLWGGTSSWGVDCSGLVQLAYATTGLVLPRDAQDQIHVARRLARSEAARTGDLLFFGRGGGVSHVAIVTAPPRFVHAYGRVEEAAFRGGGVERPELAEICLGVYRVPNPEIPPGAARP